MIEAPAAQGIQNQSRPNRSCERADDPIKALRAATHSYTEIGAYSSRNPITLRPRFLLRNLRKVDLKLYSL